MTFPQGLMKRSNFPHHYVGDTMLVVHDPKAVLQRFFSTTYSHMEHCQMRVLDIHLLVYIDTCKGLLIGVTE